MREYLRTLFGGAAERYARARPGYPAGIFDDLARWGGLSPGSRVLEIGPGTGQATRSLLARGARVTAVELSAELAAVLAREVPDPAAEVAVSAFEDWRLPAEPFDLVVAFTAWHWLEPRLRTARAAAALRPGGCLATVTTSHVEGGTSAFFAAVQHCYERWDSATPPGLRLRDADDVPDAHDEVDDSPLFTTVRRTRHQQEITYTTEDYLDVLQTYSGHLALPPDRRHGLLACVGALIDRDHGGRITKRYLYELRIARRTDLPN